MIFDVNMVHVKLLLYIQNTDTYLESKLTNDVYTVNSIKFILHRLSFLHRRRRKVSVKTDRPGKNLTQLVNKPADQNQKEVRCDTESNEEKFLLIVTKITLIVI